MLEFIIGHFNNATYIMLMMIGFYAMIGKTNLVKKLVGMNIFQWSIILFVVSLSAKRDATIPIVFGTHNSGGPVHLGFGLSHSQSSNGVTMEWNTGNYPGRFLSQIVESAPLNYPEQCLGLGILG